MKENFDEQPLEGTYKKLWKKEILKYTYLQNFINNYSLDEFVDTSKVAYIRIVNISHTYDPERLSRSTPPHDQRIVAKWFNEIRAGKPIPPCILVERDEERFPDLDSKPVNDPEKRYKIIAGFNKIKACYQLSEHYIPAIVYRHTPVSSFAMKFDNALPMLDFIGVDLTALYHKVHGKEESSKKQSQDALMLLNDGNYFQKNQAFVLGKPYGATNSFGKNITKIKGDLKNIQQQEELKLAEIPNDEDEATETIIKPGLNEVLEDELAEKNIKKALKQSKKKVSNTGGDFDLMAFEDIIKTYNSEISKEEIKAWLWYKKQTGAYNDVRVILNQNSGWSKYITQPSEEKRSLEKWIENGIICYYQSNFIPSVLYYAENIYIRQTELLKEKDEIIEKFGKKQYERQKSGLQKVLPKALNLTDPNKENRLVIKPISDFAKNFKILELVDGSRFNNFYSAREGNNTASLTTAFSQWLRKQPYSAFEKSDSHTIIHSYINGRSPSGLTKAEKLRKKQNAKIEGDRLFQEFLAEALHEKDQKKIEYLWNSQFNGYAPINYFKVPVGFSCSNTFKNKPLFIRPAQREGLGFLAAKGGGCIAYDVGVGKTMTGILSIAHALESGMCKRPLIVVPNQTYKNWLNELRGVINKEGEIIASGILPQYPVNDLYNLGSKFIEPLMDEEGNVQEIQANTISVITYEGLKRLSFNEHTWNDIGSDFYRILNQGIESQKQATKLQEKIEELMGKGISESIINIEDLGFDYLLMDEAHIMKKLFTQVKGEVTAEGKRDKTEYKITSGVPSAIALKGFMIANYVQRENKFNNIVLLTATPFTNSPLEIFSMLTLIAYHRLTEASLGNLQQFFNHFIQTSIELIINAKLKPERKEVVMGFNNLIALQQLIFQFIDYKSGEEANIQRPNKWVLPLTHKTVDDHVIPLPVEEQISTNLSPTVEQAQLMLELEQYITAEIEYNDFCKNPEGLEEESEDAAGESTALEEGTLAKDEEEGARILRGITLGRQIAFSPYLFSCHRSGNGEVTYKDFIKSSPKLQYVMGCIASVKNYFTKLNEPMSGQVIYSNAGISYFPLIKAYLVKELGFQDSEVDFIKGGMSARKKELVKEKFLDGRVKVLIGSQTIREGINLQNRATDLYNLWLDWNPTDLHQLEGRIWRFGNRFANVRIVIPLVEDSVDTAIFQKLEEKTSRINQIWHRSDLENTLKLEDFNPAELKRGLISNPRKIAEMMLLERKEILLDEIKGLENQKHEIESILKSRSYFRENIENIQNTVATYKPLKKGQEARKMETVFKIYGDYLEDDDTPYQYNGKEKLIEIKKAYRHILKAEETVLKPRGLDINFAKEEALSQLEHEIENKQDILANETDEEAAQKLTGEIIEERKKNGVKEKSISDRVAEFASMNKIILSEKMIYESMAEETEKETPTIPMQKNSADKLADMEQQLKDMEEMEKLLMEMEELKTATLNKQKKAA
jgi:hypothetical protein